MGKRITSFYWYKENWLDEDTKAELLYARESINPERPIQLESIGRGIINIPPGKIKSLHPASLDDVAKELEYISNNIANFRKLYQKHAQTQSSCALEPRPIPRSPPLPDDRLPSHSGHPYA